MNNFEVGREAVEEILHFGVKGMRWGQRKDRGSSSELTGLGPSTIVRTTKNGDTFVLSRKPPNKINKALARVSSNYRESYNKSAWLTIKDGNGKKIGNAQFWAKNKDELYLNWINIEKSARGRGYASESLKAAEEFARQSGMKKMTLEVPGNAPDARHIYDKAGFKPTRELEPKGSSLWDGLTEMQKEVL